MYRHAHFIVMMYIQRAFTQTWNMNMCVVTIVTASYITIQTNWSICFWLLPQCIGICYILHPTKICILPLKIITIIIIIIVISGMHN